MKYNLFFFSSNFFLKCENYMCTQDDSISMNNVQEEGLKVLKAKNTIFDDEEKSKLLQKLLQSKNPDDLQAANRLIKTMVREVCESYLKML